MLWTALGASIAVLICLCGSFAVMHFATVERPDSLAAMIATISDRSEQNPLLLDNTVVIPRALDAGPVLETSDEDAVFAVRAMLSADGRIENSEFLLSQHEVTEAPRDRNHHRREVADLMHAVNRSRFEPAQAITGRRAPVDMVLLFARTTVKGTARSLDAVTAAAPPPVRKHEAVKPPAEDLAEPNGVVSSLDDQLPTA
jgi:hypothetical protein